MDLIGKGGHIRTVPMPLWVKAAIDPYQPWLFVDSTGAVALRDSDFSLLVAR